MLKRNKQKTFYIKIYKLFSTEYNREGSCKNECPGHQAVQQVELAQEFFGSVSTYLFECTANE